MNNLTPEPTEYDFKEIRKNRQFYNNKGVYNCIQENNQKKFHEQINDEELTRVLAEREYYNPGYGSFDLFWNKCCNDKEYAQLAAGRLSIKASRQGALDEKLQLSACNEIAQLCGINIKDLPSTALRAHKENERILTPKDMKQYDIKKDMCLKSFDAQISGKITGFISAKVTMKTGGHQDNVFEEIDTLADWWVNHKNRSEEILILLIDTDLVDKLSIIEGKYKQYSNILMFNHYAFQKFMIDNYFQ